MLAFENLAKCQEWLTSLNFPFTGAEGEQVDCKAASLISI